MDNHFRCMGDHQIRDFGCHDMDLDENHTIEETAGWPTGSPTSGPSIQTGISDAWSAITSTVRDAVNILSGSSTRLIGGVNWVLDKLSLPNIPKVPTLGGPRTLTPLAVPVAGGGRPGSLPVAWSPSAPRDHSRPMARSPSSAKATSTTPRTSSPPTPSSVNGPWGCSANLTGDIIPGMPFGGMLGGIGKVVFKGALGERQTQRPRRVPSSGGR